MTTARQTVAQLKFLIDKGHAVAFSKPHPRLYHIRAVKDEHVNETSATTIGMALQLIVNGLRKKGPKAKKYVRRQQ